MACRFDDLGWFQFKRLCTTILEAAGIEQDQWYGRLASAVAVVTDGLDVPNVRTLPGPTVVLVAWVRQRGHPAARLRALVDQTLDDWHQHAPRSLAVVTNAGVAVDALAVDGVETVVLDAAWLSDAVEAGPNLRLREPALLGACDLPDLVREELRGLARVFVRTRAYELAVAALVRHGFAVLTGPPEMGKTAIARMIGLAKLTDGWELHECLRPDELWSSFARDRAQVFVADDAFGSTEYRPDAAERWSVELPRVLQAMDERHWLIWTSRPAPLKAGLRRIHREHGVERFPQPAQVEVDATDLSVEEKALILFRHAKAAALAERDVALVQTHGWTIVDHAHFTPERIRRFVERLPSLEADRDLEDVVAEAIREPTAAMRASLRALPPEYRSLLIGLLDVPPGPVGDRDLAAATRRHARTGLSAPLAELVDRLADHFLRRIGEGEVTWVHPSWRDLLIDELAGDDDARGAFLRMCSLDGLLLALSTEGGAAGERVLPLLRRDADWDLAAEAAARLIPALDEPATTRLLTALREARATAGGVELDALSGEALRSVARRWNARGEPAPVGSLERWFEVAATLERPPERPDVARTWIELLPTVSLDLTSSEERAQLDEWLALTSVLRLYAPVALVDFEFPERQVETTRAIVAGARAALCDPESRRELAELMRRLGRTIPAVADDAFDLADELAGDQPKEPATTALRPLSEELQRLLEAPFAPTRGDATLVAHVLRDL
ncbi:MAG TPA: hypothetical protein VFA30_05555 [Gaiellaceae bacterium]|nr:hypothetical protein [Gaiellaceae bacterium]